MALSRDGPWDWPIPRNSWLLCIFALLHLATTTSSNTKIHTIHWNASNPIFRASSPESNVIDINGGNHPWEYDQVNIVCPVYKAGTPDAAKEQYIIYSVTKQEYDSCRITQPSPKIVALPCATGRTSSCTSPSRSGPSPPPPEVWSSGPARTTTSSPRPQRTTCTAGSAVAAPRTTWRWCSGWPLMRMRLPMRTLTAMLLTGMSPWAGPCPSSFLGARRGISGGPSHITIPQVSSENSQRKVITSNSRPLLCQRRLKQPPLAVLWASSPPWQPFWC